MREAAYRAGLIETRHSHKLTLCYEPEGGFMGTVMDDPTLVLRCEEEGRTRPLRVLLLDAGGGTVDITTHNVQSVRPLRWSHASRPQMDGEAGSTRIDAAFLEWLVNDFLNLRLSRPQEDTLRTSIEMVKLLKDFEVGACAPICAPLPPPLPPHPGTL
jgi:hypothetical protein